MKYSPDLSSYIHELSASKMSYTQIVMQLVIGRGYAMPVARAMVEAVLDHAGNEGSLDISPLSPCPEIDTKSGRNILDLGDIQTTIAYEQLAPRIVVLDNFLSDAECEGLCLESDAAFFPSMVVMGETGKTRDPSVRSSSSANLQRAGSPLISLIEARIERLTGWPTASGEGLQMQKYAKGEQYLPHFDHFPESSAGSEKILAQGGQRLATLIMYLRQPDAGGATYFSNLGIRIIPRKGTALFFAYPEAVDTNGTLHCGEPVQAGEKWIVTKWFRERRWG